MKASCRASLGRFHSGRCKGCNPPGRTRAWPRHVRRIASLVGPPLLWQRAAMSNLSALPTDPKELRPLLHAEVDKLRDENLLVLHRVALELELDEVTERLNTGFDADRAAGKLARLPEIIREARAALRLRQDP